MIATSFHYGDGLIIFIEILNSNLYHFNLFAAEK